jgi:hypothetical protein
MRRMTTAIVFLISILIVGIGTFYAGKLFGGLPNPGSAATAEIVEKAKQQVPLPNLPPKPAGRTVVEQHQIVQTIQVPAPTWSNPTRMTTRQLNISTPQTRLVDASPEETAAWDAEVKKLQDEYNKQLSEKITALSREHELQTAKEFAEAVKEISTDVIVPIILAVAGIIGAVGSLRSAFMEKPPDKA